jgi:hypothetical protein
MPLKTRKSIGAPMNFALVGLKIGSELFGEHAA